MELRKLILLALLTFAGLTGFAQGFTLTGKVTGLKDSTWIYISTDRPQVVIDSAMIINSAFKLKGKVKERAETVYLHAGKDYIFFWMENKPVAITLKAGEFKKAMIKGSVTESEHQSLSVPIWALYKQQDSLSQLVSKAKDTDEKLSLKAQLKQLREKEKQLNISFIKSHPKSFFAASVLDSYDTAWGKEQVALLYATMGKEIKSSHYGKDIQAFLTYSQTINVGDKYADFEQINPQGKKVRLSDMKGKYILLDFWASWCGPCKEEAPGLVSTYNNYKSKGFEILGVALDDNRTWWLEAIKADKLPWENVTDLHGDKNRAALMYNVTGIPTNFLIDQNGIIIAKNLHGEELNKKLQELL